MEENRFIKRETTNIIKGIALVFMFVHHFFTFPNWYVVGGEYPYSAKIAEFFCEPFSICVSIFAFLTGYFYYFNSNKTFGYSFRKSTDLWIHYLLTFFVLLIPACMMGVYEFTAPKFILEVVGLYLPTMKFCWYVVFYYISIFLLPIYAKMSQKHGMLCFLLAASLPSALAAVLHPLAGNVVGGLLFDQSANMIWFSSVAAGYGFAQYGLFEKMTAGIHIKRSFWRIMLYISFMLIPFIAKSETTALDFVYAPLFLFGFIHLSNSVSNSWVWKPLSVIGKYSLSMWFLHSVFFNQCEKYTQKILYYPENPFLVLLWGLLLCLVVSLPLAT